MGVFNSPTKALLLLQPSSAVDVPVDVLFVDIQMSYLMGFDVLQPLGNRPKVIFTTAFREYTLDNYEFDVVDFLVKPVSFECFLESVGKVDHFLPTTPAQPNQQ